MNTTRHKVNLRYTRQELLALFDTAEREDMEQGGRYDKRGGAINVWSHSWINNATRHDSETIGTFYVHWLDLLYAPLAIPLVYCHINRFQRSPSVAKPLSGGENRRGGLASHHEEW